MSREVRGGLVTFFTMAYIIVLNPLIIGTVPDKDGNLITGMPIADAANVPTSIAMVAAATALIAGLMTILMGAYGRFPIAIADPEPDRWQLRTAAEATAEQLARMEASLKLNDH